MIWYRRLMGPEACIAAEGAGADQHPSPMESAQSKGEDKEFGDKWEQINEEKNGRTLEGPLSESESSHPPYQHLDPSILHHSPTHHHHHLLHHLPDEGSQDSHDIHEGSITPPTSTGSAASPCAERSQQPSSFLFVGPLGKKRKYSRQRATSDDNESEAHPHPSAGSPETLEEEMDQSQSPSPGESIQSEMDGLTARKNSSVQEQSSSPSPGEFAPRITPTSNLQSVSSDSSAGSPGPVAGGAPITSKPSPIIGAPTSVIRRTYRKKQEHPLNLSVSSPPSSSFVSTSSSAPGGRLLGDGPTNPSVIRDELYFEGRTPTTGGDRQVFVWRCRDDVNPSPSGPMSPSTSTVSATSFAVPEATGSKLGSTGSSTGSSVSQLPPGCQTQDKAGFMSGTGSPGVGQKGPKKKLRCGDCGKEFSQLRNYRYHRSRHEGSDQFSCTCPVCGKQFNDRGYLSSHMKIHRNAKEYRCEYCTKGFNQRVAYNMHRRIHTGHRPHQCEVCGKSFSRRMLLKQHMRIHTGERPYSCGVCNKAFADRSNMLLHQRLHSGERPYVCEICKKSFSKNHHLKTHMNHHAGIKPYECPKCHARFSQSSNMKTHLKKCSGVPNPTSTQRQQMLRRNPLDIGRPTAHLPPLPSVVAAAGSRDSLSTLPGTSRLLYDQQSLNLLSQSLGCNQTVPQLSPGHHSRGQVPIESLLLHLNVSRSRHPSQSNVHPGQPPSPTSSSPMSFPDLQLMLRNVVASGSRPLNSQLGQRLYSTPSPPCSSSNTSSSSATASTGMIVSSAMGSGGIAHSPTSLMSSIRRSPAEVSMSSEPLSPPSPLMVINPTLGLVGYGRSSSGHMDSSVMPPPATNGSVLRNVPAPSSSLIPPELLSPVNSMLKIDTRNNMEGFPSTMLSPPDKSGRQGQRGVTSPMMASPRRKQVSPSSLSSSGSYIPLATLENAAIASGLRSPSQITRFLTNAIRDAEAPLHANNPGSSYTSRLPSISQQNVLEAMAAAAAAAEQNISAGSSIGSTTRMRQTVLSPHHQSMQPQTQQSHSSQQYQFSGDNRPLPSLQLSHGSGGSQHQQQHHHHHHHSSNSQQQQMSGTAQSPPPPPFSSVITSSHVLQQHQDQHVNMQASLPNMRFSSSSSSPSSASRLSTVDEQHLQQQLELQQSRQYGYHQNLLLSHISQGSVTSGYSNPSPSPGYSTFTHSIIRSRSQSPVPQLPRERNQDYPN